MRSLRESASYLMLLIAALVLQTSSTAQDPELEQAPDSAPGISWEIVASDPTTVPNQILKEAREELIDAFGGNNFSELLPDDLPPGPIAITVRHHRLEYTQPGQSRRVVEVGRQTVDPNSKELTAEQRLGVIVALQEKAIREKQTALMEAKDAKTKNETLKSLQLLYAMRFEIDTAYQDYKVREIERRAKSLREEVNARENAAGDWVDAMVTLSKMRASGIETMPATASPPDSDHPYGPITGSTTLSPYQPSDLDQALNPSLPSLNASPSRRSNSFRPRGQVPLPAPGLNSPKAVDNRR